MKIIFFLLFIICSLIADIKKVYFYTTECNINNFKSLKIGFDTYLKGFGDYEFQAFSDKKTFEKYIQDKNAILILSSWHYSHIADKYHIKAVLVGQKRENITHTKVLIGKKDSSIKGIVTSAYDSEYTQELLGKLTDGKQLSTIKVPKEIDALMSVGFGMSQLALVSNDSFELLQRMNSFLAKDLVIYKESKPSYRILIASKNGQDQEKRLLNIFENMDMSKNGKKIINLLGIDKFTLLNNQDLDRIGGAK